MASAPRPVTANSPAPAARLRTAALLVLIGLLVEAGSLLRSHPTSFLVFIGVGGLALAAGIVLYLRALLRADE